MDASAKISPAKKIAGGGTSNRIGYIDALKGFAILCVVLGHVADGYINAGMYSEHFSLNVIHDAIYSFHMTLFILISGYVFYTAYFDEHDALKESRVRRQVMNLLITYIVFDIAFGLFKVICGRFTNMETSVMDVLLFPIRPIPPYWYIYLLIFYYIIFSCRIIYKYEKQMFMLAASMCLISQYITVSVFQLQRFLYYMFFFLLGIFYRKGVIKWFENPIASAAAFVVAALLMTLSIAGFISAELPGVNMIIALGASMGFWAAFEHFSFIGKNRFLMFFGRYSLEIYLLHCIFTAGARVLLPSAILNHYVLSIVFNFVISSSLPIAISIICQKLFIHSLIFKPATYFINRKTENR